MDRKEIASEMQKNIDQARAAGIKSSITGTIPGDEKVENMQDTGMHDAVGSKELIETLQKTHSEDDK